jgi:hypothetical protein
MLIYGWNSFLIRTFSAFELGLTTDFSNDFDVEVRQKYFHLFWIPFFSLGKIWCVRKGGELYDLNDEAKMRIKTANVEVKTPFYTYAGLIAVALLFVFSNIQGTTKSNDYSSMVSQIEQEKRTELPKRISILDENSYIIVSNGDKSAEYSVCKVDKMKNGAVTLLKLDGFSNINMPSINEVDTDFNNTVELANEVKTSTDNLKKAVGTSYDLFGDGQKYTVQYVYVMDALK